MVGVFESALLNQKDVTDSFCVDAGQSAIADIERRDLDMLAIVRGYMERRGILDIATAGAPEMERARRLLVDGSVAAIDGTFAINPINLGTAGLCACITGFITSKIRGTPEYNITQATAAASASGVSITNIDEILNQLDRVRQEQQSWPTTFREYKERELAMGCDAPVVLIDGPVLTQNLLTQIEGRTLYERMFVSDKTYIGVIKEINGSSPLTRNCGYALNKGEAFIVEPLRQRLIERFSSNNRQDDLARWVASTDGLRPYLRVVYCLNEKAFGLECREEDVALALALISSDASATLHHEIPLLLETIDVHMRSLAQSRDVMSHKLVSGLHKRHAIKLRNEGDFR
jgi:hypothetical protein